MAAKRATAPVRLDGSVAMYESGRVLRGRIIDVTATTLQMQCAHGYSLHALLGAPLDIAVRFDHGGDQQRMSGYVAQIRDRRQLVIVIDGEQPATLLS